jgi:hypothetical protein
MNEGVNRNFYGDGYSDGNQLCPDVNRRLRPRHWTDSVESVY